MYISYKDLPFDQKLFIDYLYDFKNVQPYYLKNFRSSDEYLPLFESLQNSHNSNKIAVANIIETQYKNLKPSKQTKSNIESLKSPNTIAIVTGQQLGLLGGPMYTLYKSITAIKLCASLKQKYDSYNFVPVFWMEGDDHDFDEIKYFNVNTKDNELKKIVYDDGIDEDVNRGSMGRLKFKSDIKNVLDEFKSSIRETEFTNDLLDIFENNYSEGSLFPESFRKVLFKLFDEYGLVIFNPVEDSVKELLKPVIKKEIEEFREHTSKVVERSAELEENYSAQVKVKPINLFLNEEGSRYLLEPVEEEFRLKGKRIKYSKQELLDILEESPDRFSPNVLLRPICQDYLFSTGFYVGGPSEVSYFAQVIPLYEQFGIEQPIIYPRASITIVEKNIIGIAEKYDLNYVDFFDDEKELYDRVISSLSSFNIDKLFIEQSDAIQFAMDRLRENLFAVDKTLKMPR
jgi:bacillithiol biosynthesis cysteine-adding enzyme BshC